MRDSIIIVGSFILGVLVALFPLMEGGFFFSLPFAEISNWCLYGMIFFVGVNIGSDKTILKVIKNLSPKVLLLPAVTYVGAIIGSVLAFYAIGFLGGIGGDKVSFLNTVTISSALGYYSISAILVTQAWGAGLGSVALLSNLFRELGTIILAPLISRKFGKYAVTAAGGVTVTDTTLPMVLRCDGNQMFPVAMYSGLVLNIVVPFILAFLLTL